MACAERQMKFSWVEVKITMAASYVCESGVKISTMSCKYYLFQFSFTMSCCISRVCHSDYSTTENIRGTYCPPGLHLQDRNSQTKFVYQRQQPDFHLLRYDFYVLCEESGSTHGVNCRWQDSGATVLGDSHIRGFACRLFAPAFASTVHRVCWIAHSAIALKSTLSRGRRTSL